MSFADLHKPGDPLLLPNAWDYGSAAILAAQGFVAIGTTSLGVAVAAGLADGQGATRDETVALAKRLRRLPCYLTVDLEQGFSDDPPAVAGLVAELGAHGVNLEDGMRDPDLLRRKIKAVKQESAGVFVNARTDTYWLNQPSLEETRRRLDIYLEAGADGIFVPGLKDTAVIEQLALLAPPNVLYGMPLKQLADLGVARVSTGSLLLRMTLGTLRRWAQGHPADEDPPGYDEIAILGSA
jgi:2-methylisocitrate lyase-like PEP mutase family enzyme